MRYGTPEAHVRRLEDDLYQARRAVLTLLPPPVQEVADDYHDIGTRGEAHSWEKELVEAVLGLAWPLADETGYSGERAYCPLCRRGSSGPYVEGFALPGGLRMHLLGEGNAHQCRVLAVVFDLARDSWLPGVTEAEAQKTEEAAAEREHRRTTEDQYLAAPAGAPRLVDELFGQPRDPDSLSWAVERLLELGFRDLGAGSIRQFTREYGQIVAYADPRELGRLTFNVFRKEQVENPKSRRRWRPRQVSVYLLDTWRHDLKGKLKARLDDAADKLARDRKPQS